MNINYYNPYIRQELELYHHGVAGQKWGKRNGPPYPLVASAHSASEKKAGWRKSLSNGARAAGRGAVKAAKATGRAVKKAAHFANKGLLALDAKPRIFMSDQEINRRVERLKLNKQYKRALKGDFGEAANNNQKQQKGESFGKDLMGSIGKQVVIPLATGALNYKIASALAGRTGDEIDLVSTVMGNRASIRRNNNGNQNGGNGNNNGNQNGGNGNRRQNRNGGNSDSSSDSTPSPRPTPDPTSDSSPRSDSHPLRDRINNLNERANSTPEYVSPRTRHEEYSNIWSTVRPFRQNQITRETLSTRVSDLNDRMRSYGRNRASYVISRHGTESFSSFVDRLSRVDDIRHSAIEEKYSKYMKLKI